MSTMNVIRRFRAPRRNRRPSTTDRKPGRVGAPPPAAAAASAAAGTARTTRPVNVTASMRVRERVAAGADRQRPEQRADGEAEIERRHVERVGRRQQVAVDQPRDDRAPGRLVDREEAPTARPRCRTAPRPSRGRSRHAPPGPSDSSPQPERGDQGEPSPVERVGERATVEAERDQRDQREDPHQPDRERGVGDRVDLDRDRHRRHLLAELRHGAADPEPSVVRGRLQRADVGQHPQSATAGHLGPTVWPTRLNPLFDHVLSTYRERTRERRWSDRCILNGLVRWPAARQSQHRGRVANSHIATRARGRWTVHPAAAPEARPARGLAYSRASRLSDSRLSVDSPYDRPGSRHCLVAPRVRGPRPRRRPISAADPMAAFVGWLDAASDRRSARAERDGGVVGRRRRDAVVPDGPAQDRRRPRVRLLHQHAVAQGPELLANPACALLFPWHPLERQVRVEGTTDLGLRRRGRRLLRVAAARLADRRLGLPAVGDRPRPRVPARPRYAHEADRFAEADVIPRPPHWGGFLVRPHAIEFWQGRPGRMHDRMRFDRIDDDTWDVERLAP